MRGPQVAAAFRRWECEAMPNSMRLPIVALTANVMDEHAAGATARVRAVARCAI
jgi:CheY-like chemotaxis protein